MWDFYDALYSILVMLFYAAPVILIGLWLLCLCRYISAKKKNKAAPGTVSASELSKRKLLLILFSSIAGIVTAVVVGFTALLYMAVAYM